MFDSVLTLLWLRSLWYRNQYIDLQSKSLDWFLSDRDLCHERVKHTFVVKLSKVNIFFDIEVSIFSGMTNVFL